MNAENVKTFVIAKKDTITRKALVVGGVLVGTIAAGLLFAKIRPRHEEEFEVETFSSEDAS